MKNDMKDLKTMMIQVVQAFKENPELFYSVDNNQ